MILCKRSMNEKNVQIINNIRNKRGVIIIDSMDIKSIRKYYEQYTQKVDNKRPSPQNYTLPQYT
jgi:hypothetical protein